MAGVGDSVNPGGGEGLPVPGTSGAPGGGGVKPSAKGAASSAASSVAASAASSAAASVGGTAPGSGTVKDTKAVADAAVQGDIMGAADKSVVATSAAAADAAAPGSGTAIRIFASTKTGKKTTRGITWVVALAVAILVIPVVFGSIAVTSVFGSIMGTISGAAAASCTPGGSGSTPIEDPTKEQVAGAIYAQAMGLGLGEVAAMIGIGVGLGETGLQNDTDGDCWRGSCANGRTSSRGVYQQFYSWPPPGTAWSGKDYGPQSGPAYTDFGGFNGSNAWGAGGWAVSDPRMNVPQAANMFFLGPEYGYSMGLEDNTLFQSLKSRDPFSIPSSTMVKVAQQVQGFPVAHMGSYEVNMRGAGDYMKKIKSGEIQTPSYVAPMPEIAKRATTAETKAAVGSNSGSGSNSSGGSSGGTQNVSDNDSGIANDGILLIGDSLMEGVVAMGNPPREAFGGATRDYTQVGIGTKAAINKWSNKISGGPSRMVVSLGTNDDPKYPKQFEEQVERFMALAGPDRLVYWFTIHYEPRSALNAVLTAQAQKHSNLVLVDTRTFLNPNVLHPNGEGYKKMWEAAWAALQSGGNAGDQVLSTAECSGFSIGAGANPLAEAALAYAVSQFGKPYSYTANPPSSWDCSKLTGGSYNYAWEQAGRPQEYAYLGSYPFLPKASLSYGQYKSGRFAFIPIAEAMPGDFIFFNGNLGLSSSNPIDHVALVLDPEKMMTAEAGSPVGSYSYGSRIQPRGPGVGIAGFPKADGSPTLPGDPGWEPVVGRLLPASQSPADA